jgi:hypothetical protein
MSVILTSILTRKHLTMPAKLGCFHPTNFAIAWATTLMVAMMTGQQRLWQGYRINSGNEGRGRADLITAMRIADKHNSTLKGANGASSAWKL